MDTARVVFKLILLCNTTTGEEGKQLTADSNYFPENNNDRRLDNRIYTIQKVSFGPKKTYNWSFNFKRGIMICWYSRC